MLYCETWGDDKDELDTALEGLTKELTLYEQKFINISRDHDEIIERCKCIVFTTQPKVTINRIVTLPLHPMHDPLVVSNPSQISSPYS